MNQPMIFPKQMSSTSKLPYIGMLWPSHECKVAWRDCGAYQDCKNDVCVPKNNQFKQDKIQNKTTF